MNGSATPWRAATLRSGTLRFGTLAFGLAIAIAAQAPPTTAALLARYGRLPAAARTDVVRELDRRCARTDYELLHQIQGHERGVAAYPAATPPQHFAPATYAPVATARRLIAAGDPLHARATAGMAPLACLPELAAAVRYDWRPGTAVHGEALTDDQRFANYAQGLAKASDHATAQILARLDHAPEQRRLGDYFAHLYADRDGAVFAGVTLFDAWASGRTIEMPDTDTIAYGVRVLSTAAFVAPLPADRRRERLYARIAEGFATHRSHRLMVSALAVTFVAAEPGFPADFHALLARAHWLWEHHGRDVEAVRRFLQAHPDPQALLTAVDRAMQAAPELASTHRNAMIELQHWLRAAADQALQNAGG
jgi:hypothetical protein